ncbi:RES family NAD+ phosphorylase [Dyella psychrodurans]|nr:RES family NAD+ phosphorylase [Dyella psychrodurans]
MEAQELSKTPVRDNCKYCGASTGYVIDPQVAEELMHKFFVRGSIPPEVGGPAPIFQFNRYHHVGEVTFATELDSDLERLSTLLGVGLFHYGPPLWRLGYTNYYQTLRGHSGVPIQGEERERIFHDIIRRCGATDLEPEKDLIFRVRKGEGLAPALASEFDSPPIGKDTSGRYESPGFPIFYGADDVETCLHESRVTLSDSIAVATFSPSKELKVLDLDDGIDDSSASNPFDRVDILLRRLAYAGKHDYDLCRELAAMIYAQGYDGFFFTSYFGQAHKKRLRNIALFGHPVSDGKLLLKSVNRVRLLHVGYEFEFGPHNDTALPIDKEKIDALAEKMVDGSISPSEAAKALNDLIGHKSSGPR